MACKETETIVIEDLQPTATFVSEHRPSHVTDHYVSLRQRSVRGGRIVLDVVVSEIPQAVSGVALSMSYPSGFSRFMGCRDGELFPVTRDPICSEPATGSLLIVRSIVAPEPGAAVRGDQVALQLEFLVFGVADGPALFEAQNVVGGSAILSVAGDPMHVSWFGGWLGGE
jgi:hypothetical protein